MMKVSLEAAVVEAAEEVEVAVEVLEEETEVATEETEVAEADVITLESMRVNSPLFEP